MTSTEALRNISLNIVAGEILAIIGPSGSGKSTLLRIIAGLDKEFTGEINRVTASEKPSKKSLPSTGFVFQSPTLLPWRTVRKNTELGLEGSNLTRSEIDRRVDDLLALTGLADFSTAYPHQLSGGMQQRLSIARALAYDPPLLLMDEPFGALDYITREQLQDDLLRIWQNTGKTIVVVTHAVDEAAYLADRVCVLTSRPGKIRAIHDVPLPRPRTLDTKSSIEFAKFQGVLREELKDAGN
ncbi:ABC transporter ATP-binding protein [Arcanobacterium ihumii]|uniref:ABC transporter ATP-binding protein n=1 Tax=Arcanobacterium ihumii TaxID=2138162 RepID=UPI000F51FF00|nr:ABC transporter ATP-binding protein [Arcanobacterium ihumii]